MSAVAPLPVRPFLPRHLTADQCRELYRQAILQTEEAVLNAWVNLLLAPHDEARGSLYRSAADRLAVLEADLARIAGGEESS